MNLDPKFLVDFLNVNVDNMNLTNKEFREVVRNTLPLYTPPEKEDEPEA